MEIDADFVLREMTGPPKDLPKSDAGHAMPMEIALLQHFAESRGFDPFTPPPQVSEVSPPPDSSPGLYVLPDLPTERPSPRQCRYSIGVDASIPARYFQVVVRIPKLPSVELRCVARPSAHYLFLAAYMLYPPEMRMEAGFDCYHVRVVGLTDDLPIADVIRALSLEEIGALLRLERGPGKPHWGDLRPLLRTVVIESAGGAAVHEINMGRGKIRVELDPARLRDASAVDRAAVRARLQAVEGEIELPPGNRPWYGGKTIKEAYRKMIPICTSILTDARARGRQNFFHLNAVESMVRKRAVGNPMLQEAIARVLWESSRLPSAKALALRSLAISMGLTVDWVRRVTRE
ncbi:MAG: hypothetical protein LAO51_06030 [Acidobacteriia bacterium]|nr:hypothetical protein [Terriglobia bacterium]